MKSLPKSPPKPVTLFLESKTPSKSVSPHITSLSKSVSPHITSLPKSVSPHITPPPVSPRVTLPPKTPSKSVSPHITIPPKPVSPRVTPPPKSPPKPVSPHITTPSKSVSPHITTPSKSVSPRITTPLKTVYTTPITESPPSPSSKIHDLPQDFKIPKDYHEYDKTDVYIPHFDSDEYTEKMSLNLPRFKETIQNIQKKFGILQPKYQHKTIPQVDVEDYRNFDKDLTPELKHFFALLVAEYRPYFTYQVPEAFNNKFPAYMVDTLGYDFILNLYDFKQKLPFRPVDMDILTNYLVLNHKFFGDPEICRADLLLGSKGIISHQMLVFLNVLRPFVNLCLDGHGHIPPYLCMFQNIYQPGNITSLLIYLLYAHYYVTKFKIPLIICNMCSLDKYKPENIGECLHTVSIFLRCTWEKNHLEWKGIYFDTSGASDYDQESTENRCHRAKEIYLDILNKNFKEYQKYFSSGSTDENSIPDLNLRFCSDNIQKSFGICTSLSAVMALNVLLNADEVFEKHDHISDLCRNLWKKYQKFATLSNEDSKKITSGAATEEDYELIAKYNMIAQNEGLIGEIIDYFALFKTNLHWIFKELIDSGDLSQSLRRVSMYDRLQQQYELRRILSMKFDNFNDKSKKYIESLSFFITKLNMFADVLKNVPIKI